MPAAASVCAKHLYRVFITLYCPLTLTFCPFDISSMDEEVTPLDDGPEDDDTTDEDDRSSSSSKGDPEQPEERTVRSNHC